jgi:hypothetical protein
LILIGASAENTTEAKPYTESNVNAVVDNSLKAKIGDSKVTVAMSQIAKLETKKIVNMYPNVQI